MSAAEHPRPWKTPVPGGWVSTIYRESSARVESPPWYFETMAFLDDGIAWESAARREQEARRQHDLAVRWFSRAALSPGRGGEAA
ncbi:hypothetical protein Gocc_2941 [Gaiella occulta]|uniref:Uncharacterized protein n=1 Tax=Gaiella occulta TaxID=1002870 RepID=A0A7M2YT45_9ACTN|nr:hypothetical protein Gocc_2941 [Gaiella occulta]